MRYGFVLVFATALTACGGSSHSQQQTGSIQSPNHAPNITSIALTNGPVYVGQAVNITLSANDVDGDKLTSSWSSTCGNFDDATSFSPVWTAPATTGDCTLSVDVTDGRGADSHDQFSLVVHVSALQSPNHAPTIASVAMTNVPVYVGQAISITLGASDVDGDKLTASWSSTCGSFDDATSFSPVWTAPAATGDCTLSVDVTDGQGAASHAQFSLVVHVSALWSAHTDLYPDNSTTGSYATWNADGSVTLTKIDPATAANIGITEEAISQQHLTSLSFDVVSGNCGGGAPRFYVTFQGDPTYYVYSCEYAHVSGATHSFLAADAFNGSLQNPPANGVISAIEIVNDVVGTTTISNIKVNGSVVSTPPPLTLTPFADACDPSTWVCTVTATGASATADASGLHLSKVADTASAAYGAGANILGVAGAPFTAASFDTTGVVSGGSPRFVLKYADKTCVLDNPTQTGNTYTFTAASTYFPCVTTANLTGLEIVADGMGNAQTITLTNITVNGTRVIMQ